MRTTLTYGILGWLLVAWSRSTLAQESIPWARNLKAAQEAAAKDGKLVLLHFWAPDCPPCQTVDRYVFPHPDVARAIATNYVPLSVNAQALPEIAKRFGVDRWPTEVIISAEGEVLSRTVSPKDAKEYVGLINRVAAAKRAPQNKWGELAQNQRQQPPAYQANQFQSAAPKPSPYVGSIANAEGQKPGGEFEPAASPYQPGRPTEATSGFGQYGMTAGGQEPSGTARNPYVSGKGATSFTGNPYVDVAAARPASGPQENPHVTSGGGFGEASPRRDFAPQGGEFAAQPWNENGRPGAVAQRCSRRRTATRLFAREP